MDNVNASDSAVLESELAGIWPLRLPEVRFGGVICM